VPSSAIRIQGYRAVLLGLGFALFVWLLIRLNAGEVVTLLRRIGWWFALTAAIYGVHQLTRTLAYRVCITAGERTSYWALVRIRLSGEAVLMLTSTGPFLSEPAKVWLLRRQGLNIKSAAAATVLEYLIYTFTSAAFALAATGYMLAHFKLSGAASAGAKVIAVVMAGFLLAAACAIVGRVYLIGAILKGLRKLPLVGKRVRLDEREVRATEDLLFVVLRDRPLRFLSVLAIECMAQALLVLELYALLRTTGERFSLLDPVLIEGATKFIGMAFFFIPGQVGAAEGTYAIIFRAAGLSATAGFALALARRLRSVLVAAIGLMAAPLER
jgi:glycosyltransferase 2 family protein